MADRASSPPPPPGSPPATPPSVKRLRDAARGVSHQMPERPTPKNVDAQLDELRRGLRVVKHGRKGKPRDTWLFLDSHDGLCWVRAGKKGEPPSVQKLSTKRRLCLRPDLDLDVVRGKQTAPLKRNKKAPQCEGGDRAISSSAEASLFFLRSLADCVFQVSPLGASLPSHLSSSSCLKPKELQKEKSR